MKKPYYILLITGVVQFTSGIAQPASDQVTGDSIKASHEFKKYLELPSEEPFKFQFSTLAGTYVSGAGDEISDAVNSSLHQEQEKNSFFHKVVQEQIHKQKKQYMRNQMNEGYLEMAQLNIEICREFAFVEEEALCIGERTIYSNK